MGKAFLSFDGERARLIVTNLYRRKRRWSKALPFYVPGVNLQNRGIGSHLLEEVVETCRNKGTRVLEVVMRGNIDRLSPWYEQHGLQVGPGLTIYRYINQ